MVQEFADSLFTSQQVIIDLGEEKKVLALKFENSSNTFRIFRFQDFTLYASKESELVYKVEVSGSRTDILKDYLYNCN